MAPSYEIRTGGDTAHIKNKKQSMADLKLRRLTELNLRLREDLDRPRVRISEAANGLISYTSNTRDFMVPSLWGNVDKREDPYAPPQSNPCCIVM
ncbi:MAG: Guanine nucleotide-binding protein subunit gamma [Vezdaea acicularis]|nr:MAG: Guanine nucleotide-binding protein subunit gamma [Vezdaea acicularis]